MDNVRQHNFAVVNRCANLSHSLLQTVVIYYVYRTRGTKYKK